MLFGPAGSFRRNVLDDTLKRAGISDSQAARVFPPMLRRRILARVDARIEKGVTLAEVVSLVRAEPMFQRLKARIGKGAEA